MATIKSFTSLEQSHKLADILLLESADMFWRYNHNIHTYDDIPKMLVVNNWDDYYNKNIPAWSLAALLCVLNFPSLTQNKENEWEACVFDHNNDDYIKKTASNPVDACVAMIEKLNELNLL